MEVVTCHFNPQGYKKPVENYWRFRVDIEKVATLHTIELSFNGEFDIPDATHICGTRQNVMWQKERLLNLLVASLPQSVKSVAWIDADLLFLSHTWFKQAEAALQVAPVIQLFEHVHFLNPIGNIVRTNPSFVKRLAMNADGLCSPGGAWAARREVFPLYDQAILGGGDKMQVEAWRRGWSKLMEHLNSEWIDSWIDFCQRGTTLVEGRMAHIRGDILHLWHGSRENRQYDSRWSILTGSDYDPKVDIALDDNGLWKWNSDKADMHELVARYFEERQEDGTIKTVTETRGAAAGESSDRKEATRASA